MKYCKYLEPGSYGSYTPRYALVEERNGVLWAVRPIEQPPIEDLAAHFAPPRVAFEPAPLADLQLLPPVTPSKILCIGRNYKEHAAELGNEVPAEPLLFLKPPSSLLAPGGTVRIPALSKRVDYEGELAIVIGRTATRLGPRENAWDYIRGFTIVNDVTARDIQKSDGQWTRGKGWDTFCPVGPIVSDEINPVDGDPVTVETRLNGQVKQHGTTRDLIFPIAHLLRYITASITLEPGDVIPTGTPSGVGPVQPGDTVEVEIPGLGTLKNTFAPE